MATGGQQYTIFDTCLCRMLWNRPPWLRSKRKNRQYAGVGWRTSRAPADVLLPTWQWAHCCQPVRPFAGPCCFAAGGRATNNSSPAWSRHTYPGLFLFFLSDRTSACVNKHCVALVTAVATLWNYQQRRRGPLTSTATMFSLLIPLFFVELHFLLTFSISTSALLRINDEGEDWPGCAIFFLLFIAFSPTSLPLYYHHLLTWS